MRLFFGFLIFAAWISVARYYFVCQLRGNCGDKKEIVDDKERAKTLSLAFGDETILEGFDQFYFKEGISCLLYTSPSPRDATLSRMPSSA